MIQINATDAKNRFGQMLDTCLIEPVFIAKSGRQHGVLLSVQQYHALRNQGANHQTAMSAPAPSPAQAFSTQNRAWVDEINSLVDQHGVWSDGLMEAPDGAV